MDSGTLAASGPIEVPAITRVKGEIATKHRVAEGVCPLFKKNTAANYGLVKLLASAS